MENDRLKEIKAKGSPYFYTAEDIKWLLAEIDKNRRQLKRLEPWDKLIKWLFANMSRVMTVNSFGVQLFNGNVWIFGGTPEEALDKLKKNHD